MPTHVDPNDHFVTDDTYAAGRQAFAEGRSVLENPMGQTGDYGRAWFAGWIDALADRLTGHNRAVAAYDILMKDDRAAPF